MAPATGQHAVEIGPSVFPEYERAAARLFWNTLNELMACGEPVLSLISRTTVDELPTAPSQPSAGDLGAYRPLHAEISFIQTGQSILNVDVNDWAAMVFEASKRALDSLMPQLFATLNDMCDAAGQTIATTGPLTADGMLDILEKMPIDFSEAGSPQLPTMVVGPQDFERIGKLPDLTTEQQARFAKILEAKKREHDAKRRVRRLDKDTSGT